MQNLTSLEPYLGSEITRQLNSADQVAFSVGVIIASVIIATIVLFLFKVLTKYIAKRTKTDFDDKLLEAAQQPVFRLIILGGVYLAALNLSIESSVITVILEIITTVAYLVLVLFCIKVIEVIIHFGLKDMASKTDRSFDHDIIPLIHKALVIIVWAFGFILVLGVWGVDVTPFLAGVGIAGLAISFALQSTLANIFAGISLIMDKTFKVGDKVQLDSGDVGIVHEISLRSTRVRTYDNEILIIPNDTLAKSKIKNFSQPDLKVRVVVPFSVEYGNKPDVVIKTIESMIRRDLKDVSATPVPIVQFTEMAPSSINFQLLFWVDHFAIANDKKLEAVSLVYTELNKAKIDIPFPTQTVYVKK